jgi:hypothetical protein
MPTRPLDESLETQKGPDAILVRDAESACLYLEIAEALADQLGDQLYQIDSRRGVQRSCQLDDDGNLLDINRYLERDIPHPGHPLLALPIAVRAIAYVPRSDRRHPRTIARHLSHTPDRVEHHCAPPFRNIYGS